MINAIKKRSSALIFTVTGVIVLAMFAVFIAKILRPDSIEYSAPGYSDSDVNEGNWGVEEKLDYIFGK